MTDFEPIHEFIFTDHALGEMARRQIAEEDVKAVLAKPEQAEMVREGRVVYQSRLKMGEPSKMCLLRVFVDVDPSPPHVVTVYRTGRVEKYWR